MSLLQNSVSFAQAPAFSRLKAAKHAFFKGCCCKNWSFATASNVDHFFIALGDKNIGYIRIQRIDDGTFRLSQMFILPEFQRKGYAQKAIKQAESYYHEAKKWVLDTIKQEDVLCHLYEKMGYTLTGIERNIKPGMDLVNYAK